MRLPQPQMPMDTDIALLILHGCRGVGGAYGLRVGSVLSYAKANATGLLCSRGHRVEDTRVGVVPKGIYSVPQGWLTQVGARGSVVGIGKVKGPKMPVREAILYRKLFLGGGGHYPLRLNECTMI